MYKLCIAMKVDIPLLDESDFFPDDDREIRWNCSIKVDGNEFGTSNSWHSKEDAKKEVDRMIVAGLLGSSDDWKQNRERHFV